MVHNRNRGRKYSGNYNVRPHGANIMTDYYWRLLMLSLVVLGSLLLGEHLYVWGYFEPTDFIGHEWYGLLFILAAVAIGAWRWLVWYGKKRK